MTWVAPLVERPDEPFTAEERAMLAGFLDYNRASLLLKCSGLTAEQLAWRAEPSDLSLLGLVRHLTDVERTWFRRRFGGQDVPSVYARDDNPDAAFADAWPSGAAEAIELLRTEQELARAAVADLSLDFVFDSPRWGPMQLRWAYSHMTAEYARHCGHADLIRERIDGAIGK